MWRPGRGMARTGSGRQMQRFARMPQRPIGLLAGLAPQTARPRELPLEPIAGRWFAAVVIVLGQSPVQLTNPLQQRGNLLALLGVLGFQNGDLFCWRHSDSAEVVGMHCVV